MDRARILALVLLAIGPAVLPAQRPARQAQAPTAFAADRLARIDRLMQQYVDSGKIAGAVGLVLHNGTVVYQHAAGWSDLATHRAMTRATLFRIASQTKALTTVVILSLMEEGKLSVSDPVSRYIPGFAHTTVVTRSDTGRVLKPASGWGWYTADKDEPICTTIERLATLPFVAQPGERWVYGYNTDILGCVAERASGMPLDELIRTRITGPLKMNDTFFFVPAAAAGRLATVYASDSTNHVYRAPDGPRGQGNYVTGPRKSFAGGAGLVSTAPDYARLLQMLLNGGELDGVRILAPHTVDLMTHNQSGMLFDTTGANGFGFGFGIVQRYGANGMASVGTFSWGGAYGSQYAVDPVEHLVIVFMINQLPNRADIGGKFPTLVYQALDTRR